MSTKSGEPTSQNLIIPPVAIKVKGTDTVRSFNFNCHRKPIPSL